MRVKMTIEVTIDELDDPDNRLTNQYIEVTGTLDSVTCTDYSRSLKELIRLAQHWAMQGEPSVGGDDGNSDA